MLQLMVKGYTCNNRNERLLFTSSEFYSELDIYLVSLSFWDFDYVKHLLLSKTCKTEFK